MIIQKQVKAVMVLYYWLINFPNQTNVISIFPADDYIGPVRKCVSWTGALPYKTFVTNFTQDLEKTKVNIFPENRNPKDKIIRCDLSTAILFKVAHSCLIVLKLKQLPGKNL